MTELSRAGFVALLGAPNAGKSTLLNRLAGEKLSIVSSKAQTTRFRIRGIVQHQASQIVLVDTPGIFAPRRRLDRAMVDAAWAGAGDADLALLVVDSRAPAEPALEIAGRLAGEARRLWLALNKIDAIPRSRLLPLAARFADTASFERSFMVSAATGDGIADLRDALAGAMPEGPPLYPPDEITDMTDRMLAAELVREQIFRQLHEEVPYGATVETESFAEREDGSARIDATIYVLRPGHKAIVIGQGGARLKSIGAAARAGLETALGRRIHLFLNVRERAGWDEETARLRAIGLEPQ